MEKIGIRSIFLGNWISSWFSEAPGVDVANLLGSVNMFRSPQVFLGRWQFVWKASQPCKGHLRVGLLDLWYGS